MDKMSSAESEDFPANAGRPGGQASPLPPRGGSPSSSSVSQTRLLSKPLSAFCSQTPLSSLPGDPLSHPAGGREKQGLLG